MTAYASTTETTRDLQTLSDHERAVIRRFERRNSSIATHWFASACGFFKGGVEFASPDTARARRLCWQMARSGILEPVRSRGGLALWWKLSAKGDELRALLMKAEDA